MLKARFLRLVYILMVLSSIVASAAANLAWD